MAARLSLDERVFIESSLGAGRSVADREPQPVRRRSSEVPLHQVGAPAGVGDGGAHCLAASAHTLKAHLAHQALGGAAQRSGWAVTGPRCIASWPAAAGRGAYDARAAHASGVREGATRANAQAGGRSGAGRRGR